MIQTLVLSLLVAAGTPPAATPPADEAADVKKAKDLFLWGQKLYKQARYAEAIAKFEEAYAVRPHPVIFFNVGKCYEQLGETAKSLRSYRDYLRMSPDAKDRETVSDAIANLERRLREKGVQQLMVFAEPATARISVDGKEVGMSPASIELVAGNHSLVVTADGYDKVERSFVMQTTRATEMTITLRPTSSGKPPPADAPRAEPTTTPAGDVGSPPPMPPVVQAPTQAKPGRVWTYVAGGVAVASVGTAVGLWAGAQGKADDLRGSVHTRADADQLVKDANGLATGSQVAYGVAGAAAVTAVILFILEK